VYIYTCTYIYIYLFICVYMYTYICIYIFTYIHVCMLRAVYNMSQPFVNVFTQIRLSIYMFVCIHTYIWCRNAQISLTYTHILCIYVYTSAWCQVKIPPIHIHPTYTYRTISHTRTHISRKYVYIYFIARHKDSSPKNRQFIICHSVHMSLWWRLVWISIWKVT